MAVDQIGAIEEQGIAETKENNWPAARRFFLEALTLEMLPQRRAHILRHLAATYHQENDHTSAYTTAEKALEILDSEGIHARRLRGDLYRLIIESKGELRVGRWPFLVAFLGGAYLGFRMGQDFAAWSVLGISVKLGAIFKYYAIAMITAPIWIFGIACLATRGLYPWTPRAAWQIGRYFLYGFALVVLAVYLVFFFTLHAAS
jgi:hypothetical protein